MNKTSTKDEVDNHLWTINVDGSSNEHGNREGLVLESLEGYSVENSTRFGFKPSNNVFEYEAILAGMDLARTVKARRILIIPDSRFVVGQSIGEFEAREKSMKKYQEAIQKRMMNFDEITFQHICRSKKREN